MSGQEEIIQTILRSGTLAAKDALDEAKEKADELKNKAEEYAKGLSSKTEREIAEESEKLTTRRIAVAHLDGKREVLKKKQEVLAQVYAKAEEKLTHMSEKDFFVFLKKAMEEGYSLGDNVVLSAWEYAFITKAFCQELEQKYGKLHFEKDERLSGGVIFRNEFCEKNFSIDALMKDAKRNYAAKIAEMLFEE